MPASLPIARARPSLGVKRGTTSRGLHSMEHGIETRIFEESASALSESPRATRSRERQVPHAPSRLPVPLSPCNSLFLRRHAGKNPFDSRTRLGGSSRLVPRSARSLSHAEAAYPNGIGLKGLLRESRKRPNEPKRSRSDRRSLKANTPYTHENQEAKRPNRGLRGSALIIRHISPAATDGCVRERERAATVKT
jgi:hypothetical protein